MRKKPAQKKKAETLIKELKITLEDAYSGRLVEMPYTRWKICGECSGKGGKNVQKCNDCKGTGTVEKIVKLMPGFVTLHRLYCNKCEGQGHFYEKKDECKTCIGNRILQESKVVEVAVEPGIPNGHVIKLYGDGNEIVY